MIIVMPSYTTTNGWDNGWSTSAVYRWLNGSATSSTTNFTFTYDNPVSYHPAPRPDPPKPKPEPEPCAEEELMDFILSD